MCSTVIFDGKVLQLLPLLSSHCCAVILRSDLGFQWKLLWFNLVYLILFHRSSNFVIIEARRKAIFFICLHYYYLIYVVPSDFPGVPTGC